MLQVSLERTKTERKRRRSGSSRVSTQEKAWQVEDLPIPAASALVKINFGQMSGMCDISIAALPYWHHQLATSAVAHRFQQEENLRGMSCKATPCIASSSEGRRA